MNWALEARISSFYYTRILELNQEKIREHPWKKWETFFEEILTSEISNLKGYALCRRPPLSGRGLRGEGYVVLAHLLC